MTPREPTDKGRPPVEEPGPDDQIAAAGAPSRLTIPAAAGDTAAVTRYLRELIDRCDGPVPAIDELAADELGTPRGTAAIARAALVWLRSKDPAVIRADLERELVEADWLAGYRIREAGLDVHGRGSTVTLSLPVSRTHWLGAQLQVAGPGTLVLLAVSV